MSENSADYDETLRKAAAAMREQHGHRAAPVDPDAYWCPECGRPSPAGLPDEVCVDCGGFDWRAEQLRGWAS